MASKEVGIHHLVEVHAPALLAWWEFLEGLDELPCIGLRRDEGPELVRSPAPIQVRLKGCLFERVLTQVDNQRHVGTRAFPGEEVALDP